MKKNDYLKRYNYALVWTDNGGCMHADLHSKRPKMHNFRITNAILYKDVSFKLENGLLYFSGTEIEFNYISDNIDGTISGLKDKRVTIEELEDFKKTYYDIQSYKKTKGIFKKEEHIFIKKGFYERRELGGKFQAITSNFSIELTKRR